MESFLNYEPYRDFYVILKNKCEYFLNLTLNAYNFFFSRFPLLFFCDSVTIIMSLLIRLEDIF